MRKNHNHLRIYRKKSHLTQEDMVHVMGNKYDFTYLSKCENGSRATNIEILITYHLIFDTSIEKLLARKKESIRKAIIPQIQKRISTLRDTSNLSKSRYRIQNLENALTRLTQANHD